MKQKSTEHLLEQFKEIDDDLLDVAICVSDPEALRKHIASHKRKRTINKVHALSLIAACLALFIGLSVLIPFLRTMGEGNHTIETSSPSETEEAPKSDPPIVEPPVTEGVKIESVDRIVSFDMMNYYAALKVLLDPSDRSLSVSDRSTLLALTNLSSASGDLFTNLSSSGVVCYEFDCNGFFSITEGTFFQIVVTEEDQLLASLVGTGIVDVTITCNAIEPMITLRNKDRYISCIRNGDGSGIRDGFRFIQFSLHKTTDGFHIIKNFTTPGFFWLVYGENGEIAEFYVTDTADEEAIKNRTIKDLPIVGKTYTVQKSEDLTIPELEDYFSTEKYLN